MPVCADQGSYRREKLAAASAPGSIYSYAAATIDPSMTQVE